MSNAFVFRIGHLGDTLVALPAIKRIHQLHDKLLLITNRPAREGMVTAWDVLKHTGYISEVLFFDTTLRGRARLGFQLRRAGAARLYYLSPPRSRIHILRDYLFFRTVGGVRELVGFDAEVPPLSPRDRQGRLLRLQRESNRLLRILDTGPAPAPPFLCPSDSHRQKVDGLLAGVPPGATLVGFGVGSKMPAKKWPRERYIEIANRLVRARPDVWIMFSGGREDFDEGETICGRMESRRVVNLAGKTDIIESAEALSRCSIYVGNDTGTMHLAAAMGVRCVAIFTSRDNPGLWEPHGDGHEVLRRDLDCSGCMLEVCTAQAMRCLDQITCDQVWNRIWKMLQSM